MNYYQSCQISTSRDQWLMDAGIENSNLFPASLTHVKPDIAEKEFRLIK